MCIDKLRTPNIISPHFSDGFCIREAQKEEMDEIYLMASMLGGGVVALMNT